MKKVSKTLSIAMLGHKRIPSREGGIEVVIGELSTRMVQCGYKVTCYNRKGHHVSGTKFDVKKLKEYKGVSLKYVPTINRKGIAAVTSSFFGTIYCAFGKYDVVHFHAEGPCAMLWLPKLLGKRCIVTVHGLDHQRAKWGIFARTYIMLGEKCASRFADEIIVLNEENQRYFKETYGRSVKFIPNGVNKPDFRKAAMIKKKFGLEKDMYFLYLGRIVPEKGILYLIRAFQKINTDKKLVIAGGVSDTGSFMKMLETEADGDNRIIFTNFVQGQVLEELYSNAYAYVLPSDLEGMPLSLLEAMSYGNCCVVSDIPECVEIVEDKAVIFRKGDIPHLAEKLQELCDNQELVERYRKGVSDFICRKYNWDDVVKKTLQVYHGYGK